MIQWLESVPQEELVARSYLNREKETGGGHRPWIPEAYEANVPLSETWRRRYAEGQARDMSLAGLLTDLDRMEHESEAALKERHEPPKRPLIFGRTPLLTDALPGGREWLEERLGNGLLTDLERETPPPTDAEGSVNTLPDALRGVSFSPSLVAAPAPID